MELIVYEMTSNLQLFIILYTVYCIQYMYYSLTHVKCIELICKTYKSNLMTFTDKYLTITELNKQKLKEKTVE